MKRPRYESRLLLFAHLAFPSVCRPLTIPRLRIISGRLNREKVAGSDRKCGLYKISHDHMLITCMIVSIGSTLLICFTELWDVLTSLSPTVTLNLLAWPSPLSLLPVL